MRLRITHRTEYHYGSPLSYALLRLRLVPRNSPLQTVQAWSLAVSGAREEVRFFDQFENETRLVSTEADATAIIIEAVGEIETRDKAGVLGEHRGFTPLWLYQRETALTEAGEGVRALAGAIDGGTDLERLHRLMGLVVQQVAYAPGATDASSTAEQALSVKSGVCQDHAHVFISAARLLGFPARYVSGYLKMEDAEQVATHAWAEAHVPMLGWVGFDASNDMSPDERYVRIAVGRDYREASPVSGIRLGVSEERLAVSVTVEQ